MKTEHYPSLELCKKLTEIGFPETEKKCNEVYSYQELEIEELSMVCPSVMEMLDVMPGEIKKDGQTYYFDILEKDIVSYKSDDDFLRQEAYGSLQDSLAAFILWLHENNNISFTK